MIDLNTCQPGQQMIRHDGLKGEYVSLNSNRLSPFRHVVLVEYEDGAKHYLTYTDDGQFLVTRDIRLADIAKILPLPIDTPVWSAKISADHVEASSGFWAVYQGEA